ncbi:MAG: tetratricopeptide repeat protein, partial [Novipirellula sp. JB048]
MADPKADTTKTRPPAHGRDKISTALMVAAAMISMIGLGVAFAAWFGTGPPDAIETLKIASREYMAGNPIVAGQLAQTVDLAEAPFSEAGAATAPREPKAGQSGAVQGGAGQDAATTEDATTDDLAAAADPTAPPHPTDAQTDALAEWRRLRQFLIHAGNVMQARTLDDARQHRHRLFAVVPEFEAAVKAGLPAGREVDGKRLLAESLYRLGQYDKAAILFEELLTLDPTLRRSLLPSLAESRLRSHQPRPAQALN